jgi:hypothetical protein
MLLYIVGKNIAHKKEGVVWELAGVYDNEEKALAVCTNRYYFIGPITLNQTFPKESIEWPGAYYPYPNKK